MFSAAFVGFGLIAEWRAGGVERMRVLYGAGVFCKESP